MAFDSSSNKTNVCENSTIKKYIDEYGKILNEGLEAKVTSVGLITVEELESLGCSSSSHKCSGAPSFVRATSYWTSSPGNANNAWLTDSLGDFKFNYVDIGHYRCGVRPVITISKSLFE